MSAANIVPVADVSIGTSTTSTSASANTTETVTAVPTIDDRLPVDASTEPTLPAVELPSAIMDEQYHIAKELVIAHFEKAYLARLVERSGGNMSKAARLASIDRTTIYRMMDRHHLSRAQLPGLVA